MMPKDRDCSKRVSYQEETGSVRPTGMSDALAKGNHCRWHLRWQQ